jgi:tRNA dimethylallyltransferase
MIPTIPIIVGPTASGKTEVAIHLAQMTDGEIVSADSRQVYRYLDIGTAKPSRAQLNQVKHHFIDEKNPDELFTAGQFGIDGRRVVGEILGRGKTPIVVGGSGLYVTALIDGLFKGPASDPELRKVLEEKLVRGCLSELLDDLRRVDPESFAHVDPTKPRRIVRALEVYYLTGTPISRLHRERKPEIPFVPFLAGLSWDRAELYRKIEHRCRTMLDDGLLDEVQGLKVRGYDRRLNALNTVGYSEAFAFLEREIPEREMMRLFMQNSRRYAKRQMTWFRRDERIHWVMMGGGGKPQDVAAEILEHTQPAR